MTKIETVNEAQNNFADYVNLQNDLQSKDRMSKQLRSGSLISRQKNMTQSFKGASIKDMQMMVSAP